MGIGNNCRIAGIAGLGGADAQTGNGTETGSARIGTLFVDGFSRGTINDDSRRH